MAEQLAAELQVLDDALRASEEDIMKLQQKLRDARTKQNAIATRMETATNRVRMREMYAGNRTAEAFSKFEQLDRHADEVEGYAEALGLG